MKDIIEMIAEGKIREAMERGEFENLPGKGKPLKLEDYSNVPEDLRICYKVLKNAGFIPEEIELQKEIISLRKFIDCCSENEKEELNKKLRELHLRHHLLMEKSLKKNKRKSF